ncbi:MAG: CBS domain-containing protein [Bacillota bacterium]
MSTKSPFVVYLDQTLDRVLKTAEGEYGRIPVVSREDGRKLIGVLRHDILRAYRRGLEEALQAGAHPQSIGTAGYKGFRCTAEAGVELKVSLRVFSRLTYQLDRL